MQSNQGLGLRIFVHVFGCRTSLCEGEYIAGTLSSYGASITEGLDDEINAAVIVTCSVTREADRKCRQLVRRVRRMLGDDGVLAVCGCWSQALDAETAQELGIDILSGSRGKNVLPELVVNMLHEGRKFRDVRTKDFSQWEELRIDAPVMHSRAFVKIQDGCNHFCTYCVIPFLRGRPVSRPINSILDEVRRLIEHGYKEIVFTGIHLGIFGRDSGTSLAELIRDAAKISGLSRLRLGSLEPFCLNDDLLYALSDCESFCPHLHLPVQSGDDVILSAMRRGYTAGDFVKVCERAREVLGDDLHISSDILVGFPGESEEAFAHTLDIMKNARLGRVHVFPYSEREGTIAAGLPKKIPPYERDDRASRAIALGRTLYSDYVNCFIGREVEVLIEKNHRGHTRHYIEAEYKSWENMDNEIVRVEAVKWLDGWLKCVRRN